MSDDPSRVASVVHVAVAVIVDAGDRILLTRRHADAHQGGLWEFPGGKREAGETLVEALARELLEELGIVVTSHRPLLCVSHDYGDKQVLLDVHEVSAFGGEPQPREGQPMQWVPRRALRDYAFPEGNRLIVEHLLGDFPGGGARSVPGSLSDSD